MSPAVSGARAPAAADSLGTRRGITPPVVPQAEGTLAPGTMLQNRYQIIGVLGVGGMATVYKARDMRFANVTRLCAVKEMVNQAPDPQAREMARQNFEREANILATTKHPAMPQIYDFFSESTRSYLVMELIDGQNLEDYVAELQSGEFLDESLVVEWALQICDVLSHLHSHKPQPIIFRDLKLGNIMLDHQERIRLIDFGIAKVFQTGQKGTMIGTEGYSPPEQYRGVAEPRGDIYALGATIHHLLTMQDPRLEPPFSFQERPISVVNPQINPKLESLVMKALEYDVDNRFSSVDEFKKAIMSATHRGSVRPQPQGLYSYTDTVETGDVVELWRFACEDEVRSSPRVQNNVLYVGAYDNNLYAINVEGGEFVWKYPTDGGIASSPYLHEEHVMIGSNDNILHCVNARSGRLEWTCHTKGSIYSSPREVLGRIFFGSDDCHIYAVSADTGRVVWKVDMGVPIRSSAAIGEGLLYFGCEDGAIVALEIGSGDPKWRFRARRGVMSSPCIDPVEGIVFVGSMDWNFYALDASSGWPVWRTRTGGPIISSPLLEGNRVFVGSADKCLYALDTQNGRELWKYETEGQVTSSPAYANGVVYVGSVDGHLYSIDASSGELRWRYKTGGPVTSSPTVEGDAVYVGSNDRYVYAIPA
jgi:outer membrane protein assembly factor BamB/tRNA A-37 threonylcarbamoyl transferase component Bud32